MTASRRLATLPLLLIGLAALCAALVLIPWVVQAQSQAVTPTAGATGDTPPAKPTNLQASAAHDAVTLTWTASTDQTVTHYAILRRHPDTDASQIFHVIESNAGPGTSYTDSSVSASSTYIYRVKAVSPTGVSSWSGYVKAETPAAPDPEPTLTPTPDPTPAPEDLRPTGLTVSLVENKVTLSWSAPAEDAESVDGYEILRRRPMEGETSLATLVADTESTATTYTDATATEAGVRYVYRVKARRGDDVSLWSNFDRIDLPADYVPDPESTPEDLAPSGLTATLVEGGGVSLSLDRPGGGRRQRHRLRDPARGGRGSAATLVADTGNTATAYTDATATEPGETYAYQVKAIRGEDRSQASGEAEVQIPDDAVDLAPSNLTATLVEGGGVSLSWSAPAKDADSVTGYEILRAVGEGEMATLVADTGNTATAYTDATATEPGETYAYQVKAIRGEDRSQASGQAEVQIPDDAVDLAPSNLTATLVEGGGVSLTWTAPAKDADSVTGYEILRAVGEGEFTTLVTDTQSTATTYTDASASDLETSYVYRVVALRGGVKSQQSNDASADPPVPGGVALACATDDDQCSGPGPTNVALSEVEGGLELSWEPPPDPTAEGAETDVHQYQIMRSPGDDDYALLSCVGADARSYLDATAEAGGQYRYLVRAIYFPNDACAALRDIHGAVTIDGATYTPVDGLWSDGTTLWASDKDKGRILAFTLADGARDSGKDIVTGARSDPSGLWGRNGTLWALTASRSDITLDGFSLAADSTFGDRTARVILGPTSGGSDAPPTGFGLWGDEDTFWVSTPPRTSLYAYDWATSGTLARQTAKELSPSVPARNDMIGLWGDGTTVWIATTSSHGTRTLYAVDWPAGTRNLDREIALRAAQGRAAGLWSDGELIWVSSQSDNTLYAYPLRQDRQHSAWSAPVAPAASATGIPGGQS